MPSARVKRLSAKYWYASKKEDVCAARKNYYYTKAEQCKETSRQAYHNNPDGKKMRAKKLTLAIQRNSNKLLKRFILKNPDKFKEASKKAYFENPDKFKKASKCAYANNPYNKKEAIA